MTTVDSSVQGSGAGQGKGAPGASALRAFVHGRISRLQDTRERSSTTAVLAHLRRAVAKPPGAVPEVWEVTMDGLPGVGKGDEPSRSERAAHLSFCLYAIHQQAVSEPMHVPGRGLGSVIAELELRRPGQSSNGPSPVRRRFNALGTASSFEEVSYHLRGLVTQIRTERIPLDYGALADDLLALQSSAGAARVRLAWARQLYRIPSAGMSSTTSSETKEAL